jgi:extradiol dioxygenase family protein
MTDLAINQETNAPHIDQQVRCHFALPVRHLSDSCEFYQHVLGWEHALTDGASEHLYNDGNHLVLHEAKETACWDIHGTEPSGAPLPHLGMIVSANRFREIHTKAEQASSIIYPLTVRRQGTKFEHSVFFVSDPSDIPWEVKHYHQS